MAATQEYVVLAVALSGMKSRTFFLYYRIFRPITRALSIQKRSKIVKNEHARYTLERFPTDFRALSIQKRSTILKNERGRYTLGARYRSENTVIIIKAELFLTEHTGKDLLFLRKTQAL
jgi:hypothetical protein